MEDSFVYFLSTALVPVLTAYVAAGSAYHVHSILITVVAMWTFPNSIGVRPYEIFEGKVYIPFQVNHLHGQTEPVPRRMRATLTETEPVLFDVNYQTTVC